MITGAWRRLALACGGALALSLATPRAAADDGKAEPSDADAPPDPKNKKKPALESKDLEERAKKLFEAIQKDDPKIAKSFFFPWEPFIPLKDIGNPGKYWDQLYRVYEKDIHELHRKHAKELDGAEFDAFELGSKPGWVKPGEEANKIGYYRTFNGKLRYKVGDKTKTLQVKVIISWNDRWYITHLLPFKKK